MDANRHRMRLYLAVQSEAEGEGSVGQVGEDVDMAAAAAHRQHLEHKTHPSAGHHICGVPRCVQGLTRCSELLVFSCSVLRLGGVHGI